MTIEEIKANPELFKKIQIAINESLEYAQKNPDQIRAQLPKFTKLGGDVAAKLILQAFVLAKDAAPSHVLAHHHHALVGFHFALHGQHGGLAVTHRLQNH